MKRNKTKVIIILLLVVIAGAAATYMYLYKPSRTAVTEKGIEVTAVHLVKDYQANEEAANAKYLDKTLQVTGTISAIEKSQEGQQIINLSSGDDFTGVYCTMLKEGPATVGQTITIKGFCSGMLSDVRIREAIIISIK